MDSKVAQAKEARKAASLLLLASARGYLDDVKALLSSDDAPLPTDGAVADKRRATPAHYAAAHNRVSILRHLWSIGAELDAEDSSGKTPLHYAVAGKAKEAVEFLVATAKAWPGAPDGAGDDTPLHLAARSGDVDLAKAFLKAVGGGASAELLKDRNKRGLTPLGEALLLPVSLGAAATAEAAGATAGKDSGEKNVSALNISKETVFAMADALLEASAGGGSALKLQQQEQRQQQEQEQRQQQQQLESNNIPRGWPLLHVLSAAGSAEGVEWLLEKASGSSSSSFTSINGRSSEATGSLTPLHAAAIGANVKVAELLIAAGADVAALDGAGRTPAEAFEAAFAAATRAAAAPATAANAAAAAAASTSASSFAPPLPLATAAEAKRLRSLLEVASSSFSSSSPSSAAAAPSAAAAATKRGSSSTSSSSTTSSASVEAFSNDADSFAFSFESPAATFKALPEAEQLAQARRWAELDGDDALGSATSMFSPAAFEQAKLARGMRHAKTIAQVVASLHDDEDFQEAAKLKRVKEAVAAVRRDPSSAGRFQGDPKAMDVLLGLRRLQAVCAANGRHVVPFEELVVEAAERAARRREDADRVAGLGRLHEAHLRAAAAAAAEDDPKEALASAERALAAAAAAVPGKAAATAAAPPSLSKATATAGPAGLLARAKAVLAAASADADRAEAAAAAARGEQVGTETRPPPFDWSAFWKSLSKAMAASLVRAAIAFVVLWMVMKATSPPPATVAVPPAAPLATEAEL